MGMSIRLRYEGNVKDNAKSFHVYQHSLRLLHNQTFDLTFRVSSSFLLRSSLSLADSHPNDVITHTEYLYLPVCVILFMGITG